MSHLAGKHQTRHGVLFILVLLSVLLLGSAIASPRPAAAQETPVPTPTLMPPSLNPSPEDILAEAQRANDTAERANQSVNNTINALNFVFAFIQVLGIVGGLLVVFANWHPDRRE